MGRGVIRRGSAVLAVVLAAVAVVLAAAPARAAGGSPVPTWAYYYIWYNASSWNRAKIDYPLLGRYSSDEASVMRAHIRLAKQAGLDGFIVSWKSTPQLDARLRTLARVATQEHFKLSIIYQGLDFHRHPLMTGRIALDLERFVKDFAPLPVFHGFGPKPVVIWSGTWEFSPAEVASVTARFRDKLRILASERNADDYRLKAASFDGDAYYWSSVNPDTYPGYVFKLQQLSDAVHSNGGLWFAPAAPGFDGHLVGHPTVVPRNNGDTLRRELDGAQRSNPDAIALISWNEFSENSHVEPSHRYGTEALQVLADVHGTRLRARDALDSSQPDRPVRGEWAGAIPSALAFVFLGVGAVLLLRRRKRARAVL